MDPFTHTLFGAALADSGLKRFTPLATATLLLGANAPDIDFVTYFGDSDLSLDWRRGWTHGVLAMVVLPLLLTGLMILWDRLLRRARDSSLPPARFAPLLTLACLGVWSHPILDWLNTYGVRLLMPFSGRWFYGDTLFIIDPFLWLLLGGAAFLRHSGRRRTLFAWAALGVVMTLIVFAGGSLILCGLWVGGLLLISLLRFRFFAHLSPTTGHYVARGALAAGVLYIAFLMVGSRYAAEEIRATLEMQGIGPVQDLLVGPVPANPLRRDVVAVTTAGYHHGNFAWLRTPRLELESNVLPRLVQDTAQENPVIQAALAAPCLRGMAGWVRYPFTDVTSDAEGHDVWLLDARYTRHRTQGFGSGYVRLDSDLAPRCEKP